MSEKRLGIIMNGVTGRMGKNQHLIRSILEIMKAGGLELADGVRVMPDPILVGRDAGRVGALAREHGLDRWTDDLDAAIANPDDTLFFDAATTQARASLLFKAIDAGKNIYCEKPTADNLEDAYAVYKKAKAAGIKHGVVQDKLWLPGIRKLKYLIDAGFFGRILSVRGEFGYWVFDGELEPAQRPSWNYKKSEGGGIILDMLCHWRYVLDSTFGAVKAVSCLGATHIPKRWDEHNQSYGADVDDAAYATFRLEGDVIAHFNSSWCTRVRRDDLLTLHVDGTNGSAVAGLRRCRTQSLTDTPMPVWNPDIPPTIDYNDGWQEVPDSVEYDNAFKVQWELFIHHLYEDNAFPWDLLAGAKGVQLAELGLQSWSEGRWLQVPDLETRLCPH